MAVFLGTSSTLHINYYEFHELYKNQLETFSDHFTAKITAQKIDLHA